MKVKIVSKDGSVTVSVQRPGDKKPTEVALSAADARALAGWLNTAAHAKNCSIEWEQS